MPVPGDRLGPGTRAFKRNRPGKAGAVKEKLEAIISRYHANEGNAISVLQDIEAEFGYVRADAIEAVCNRLDWPPAKLYGIATFYAQFHLEPRGKNIITACCGTACHVRGAERVIDVLRRELAIPPGEDTTRDRNVTIEKVNCVGACSIAPVVIVNKSMHGNMTKDKIVNLIETLPVEKPEKKGPVPADPPMTMLDLWFLPFPF